MTIIACQMTKTIQTCLRAFQKTPASSAKSIKRKRRRKGSLPILMQMHIRSQYPTYSLTTSNNCSLTRTRIRRTWSSSSRSSMRTETRAGQRKKSRRATLTQCHSRRSERIRALTPVVTAKVAAFAQPSKVVTVRPLARLLPSNPPLRVTTLG